jgi:CDP-glucose 4,6-dehydratase
MAEREGSMESMEIGKFFHGKRIFVTGHTGFKGAWLSKILTDAGAVLTGYALPPPTTPNLFDLCDLDCRMTSEIGDIQDLAHLSRCFREADPEIVFHLAAQPIVRDSYKNPVLTYGTNVMGTVHLLECVRLSGQVKSVVNVTTDKVYQNLECARGYCEDDVLNGYDPYSNSKSCSELVTSSYRQSFFHDGGVAVSTARAGNVIGGGDFASDRILPDCLRAAQKGMPVIVRNPHSTRPFQHVLDPIFAYLLIAEEQFKDQRVAGSYNIGPADSDCITTGALVDLFVRKWGNGMTWDNRSDGGPHEAHFLRLDCTKLRSRLGWTPRWDLETAVEKTVEWTKVYFAKGNIKECMDRQIEEFLSK